MQDNTPPSGEGEWNTDELLEGGMSSKEIAIFMNAYMSNSKSLIENCEDYENPVALLDTIQKLVAIQSGIMGSIHITDEQKQKYKRHFQIGIAALGYAIASEGLKDGNLGLLAHLASAADQSFTRLLEKEGNEAVYNSVVNFQVRRGEGGKAIIGVKLVPIAEVAKEIQDGYPQASLIAKEVMIKIAKPDDSN